MREKWVSVKEFASRLGIARSTLFEWVKQGRIPPAHKFSSRVTRWHPLDAADVLRNGPREPGTYGEAKEEPRAAPTPPAKTQKAEPPQPRLPALPLGEAKEALRVAEEALAHWDATAPDTIDGPFYRAALESAIISARGRVVAAQFRETTKRPGAGQR